MSLALIQAKRHVLVQQKDQQLANLNATIGAIAMCDELLGELQPASVEMLPVVHDDADPVE